MSAVRFVGRHSLTRIAIGLVVLVVGAGISAAAFVTAGAAEERRIHERLEFRADWRANDLEHKISSELLGTLAVATMIATAADPAAETFDAFVRNRLLYTGEHPSI